MTRSIGACLLASWLVLLAGGAAAAPRAVVELFTSQGCSSCPPADRMLAEMAGQADVIALTLPVDYWDYLGWKDTLAQPAFTARQRAYAGLRGDRKVFTPQMVVNGTASSVGSDRAELARALAQAAGEGLAVPISVAEEGRSIRIEVGAPDRPGSVAGEVWILPVATTRTVAIGRGENQGRSATYANVVRGLRHVGSWSGRAARYDVPVGAVRAGEADAYVVLVQAGDADHPGPILGAARGGF